MFQLVYVSSMRSDSPAEELVGILAESRERNGAVDVTGILLHVEGNVMQLLEGPKDAVEDTFHRIAADPRHTSVIALLRRETGERLYDGWEMASTDMAWRDFSGLPGISDVLDPRMQQPFAELPASAAVRLLESFREQMMPPAGP